MKRKSWGNQPVYVGVYRKANVQISFSGDRINNERVNFIDISFVLEFKNQTTIASTEWFRRMDQDIHEDSTTKIVDGYVIRSDKVAVMNRIQKKLDSVMQRIKDLEPFDYVLFSQAGLIFEMQSKQIIEDLQPPEKIITKFDAILDLAEVVR